MRQNVTVISHQSRESILKPTAVQVGHQLYSEPSIPFKASRRNDTFRWPNGVHGAVSTGEDPDTATTRATTRRESTGQCKNEDHREDLVVHTGDSNPYVVGG